MTETVGITGIKIGSIDNDKIASSCIHFLKISPKRRISPASSI